MVHRVFFLCLLFFGIALEAIEPPNSPSNPAPPPQVESESPLVERFWKYHKFAAIGYRRDRQTFTTFQAANSNLVDTKIKYFDRDTIQLSVGSHMEWKILLIDLMGSYGWLANGNASVKNQLEGAQFHDIDLKAGYTADLRGSLGVRIKLYDVESFGFSVIPGGGYQYSHIMNYPKGNQQNLLGGPGNNAVAQFPSPNQQDWFGPFVQGMFEFRFQELVILSLFYQYQMLDLRAKTKENLSMYLFSAPNTLESAVITTFNTLAKGKALRTQLGGIDIKYHSASAWTFGVHFEGMSTWSKTDRIIVKTNRNSLYPAPSTNTETERTQRLEVSWVQYNISLFAGYKF